MNNKVSLTNTKWFITGVKYLKCNGIALLATIVSFRKSPVKRLTIKALTKVKHLPRKRGKGTRNHLSSIAKIMLRFFEHLEQTTLGSSANVRYNLIEGVIDK